MYNVANYASAEKYSYIDRLEKTRGLNSLVNKRNFSSTARLNTDSEDNEDSEVTSENVNLEELKEENTREYLRNLGELEEHREEHSNITERLLDECMEVDMGDADNEKIEKLAASIEEEENRCSKAVSDLSDSMYNEDREDLNDNTQIKDIYPGTEKVIGQVINESLKIINQYTDRIKKIVENSGVLDPSSNELSEINRLIEERNKYTNACNDDISRQIDTIEARQALERGLPLPEQEPEQEPEQKPEQSTSKPDTVIAGPSGTYVPVSKRKREENEDISEDQSNKKARAEETPENPTTEPNSARTSDKGKEKESLLDDFADPSTESPDYMGGDD